jgi:hypothetical protein
MKKIIVAVALAVCACTPENEAFTVTEPGDIDQRATWQANVVGRPALPNARGTVQLADYGAYFNANLSLTSANPSSTYAWRIWPGTCAAPVGTVQYGPVQAYPNVTTNSSGAASVTRTISGPLNLSGTYHVRVMPSNALTNIVACGDLQH